MADKNGKIVLDPIYGMIELDALAVKIIDTPCFQRLRYIKQLSVADFVYPGATHTRFAHSIGVYHLACEMIKRIKSQGLSEAVRLTDKEETCLRVAALCHDIGHGPFSHTYEHIFKDELKDVKHEHISVFLVEKMFKDNINFDLEKEKFDIGLIQALIQGNYDDYIKVDPEMKVKKYLFQIVSNKTSGMDVDKWDYFNRDAIACGVPERFQFDRALHVAGVFKVNGVYELSYREHDAFSFYNMYNTRLTLYRKVYRHRVVVAVELMVKDVFQIVSEANKSPAKSGKENKDGSYHVSEENENSAKPDNV
ncbi:hypothetical protein ACJMK2_022221 [Sinanodonta woodiana]|uniref:HD domain-containing protein n=1 Tax=Sinanodonta woodiana TaxID=1069815 RepID=A0ABD3TKZ6_SINWO